MRDPRSLDSFDIRLIAGNVKDEGTVYPADRELVAELLLWLADRIDSDKAKKPA